MHNAADLDRRAHPGAGEPLPFKGCAADRDLAVVRQQRDWAERERDKLEAINRDLHLTIARLQARIEAAGL